MRIKRVMDGAYGAEMVPSWRRDGANMTAGGAEIVPS